MNENKFKLSKLIIKYDLLNFKDEAPEESSSLLSRLTFFWINP
jgi:hypothetical protein